MHESLRIVAVAPDLAIEDPGDDHAVSQAERSRGLRIGLLENGFNLIAVLPADVFLQERINQLQPDLIIVDAESQARDALEHVVMATREARRPIVMFTNHNDTSHVRQQLADTKTELKDRKVIDRAKGLLMQRQNLSEQQAFDKLRKTAMDKGLKLADVAQRMLDVADLLA